MRKGQTLFLAQKQYLDGIGGTFFQPSPLTKGLASPRRETSRDEDYVARLGGDEFAAIVKDCTPDAIEHMVAQFEQAEKEQNVSISLGYAYAEEIGRTTFRKLLDEADQKMYAQKKLIHSRLT